MKRPINPIAQFFTKDELKEIKRIKDRIHRNLMKSAYIGLPHVIPGDDTVRAGNALGQALDDLKVYYEKALTFVPALSRKEFNDHFRI